ncbi:uncharacterized protein LOC128185748 isoform X4 [Crassostrea angulata]|uniref:uncharacterized protein LOC128185748 isoform X4 n=1 Tax=Magallana angulata TaxID=2784310 RepID=UPI0022B17654|nr:uncharacterized protein LOC128185748 isoform X4 [Crassostrea angulata]
MMRGYVVLFLSIHLFEQIQILDAFILSCNASLQTVRRVTMCPSNISAYEEAVQKKNCSSLAPDAQTCQSFQYHCVLNDDLNYAIEVCAPSMYIVGYVCTKFSTIHKSIMRIDGFACNDSFTACPFGYNSTESFKYLPCYANVNKLLPTELPPRREISETVEPWLIVLVIPIILGIGCLIFCRYTFVRKRRTFRRRQGMAQPYFPPEVFEFENRVPTQNSTGPGQALLTENQDDIDGVLTQNSTGPGQVLLGENQDDIDGEGSLQTHEVPLSSNSMQSEAHLPIATITEHVTEIIDMPPQMPENRQNHLNNEGHLLPDRGVISSFPSDQSQMQPNERNLQTEDDALSSMSPDLQQTSSNEGTWHQARMKTTISAASETDQIMLECAVNFLLRNLENPDESWTKEKIVSHVEKTIQQLINSNAEELLISFIKRLDRDKKIAATLLKCGEEMFKLISSFQEKYVANKLKISYGCVCVTFCFADSSDLENYLEKVRNKDKHLITGLSKILLNETFLRIFDINPRVVTWKVSELKVYKGSELVKTETFLEPLTGSQKVLTRISEESSEESEDEKKCNKFRSNEKSKYPGYMKYRTRAKSFNDCNVDWLKDKKEEFARYGFLYQGVDLKTTCFHCGFSKDNWTEKDDIFATHFFSEKSCAYVQYLNTSIEKYVFH